MRVTVVWTVLAALLLLVAPRPVSAAGEKDHGWLVQALSGVRLGDGVAVDQLILFPLLAKSDPAPLAVSADHQSSSLVFSEPEFPLRRENVEVVTDGETPVLVLGGGVLVGGRLDRLVARSFILTPGANVEFEALPAEDPRDRRKEPRPFFLRHARGGAVAPPFLRERAIFDPSKYMVPIFVSHFLDFRDEKDSRRSLAAIESSATLGTYCEACRRHLAPLVEAAEGNVLGVIIVVRGRIQTLELFGSNALFRSYFDPLLRSHACAAAAIELRAKKIGMPVPGTDDPAKAMKVARRGAESLLQKLGSKVRLRESRIPEGALGQLVLLRTSRTKGEAIGLEGRLVHAVVFPENPFEEALFSRALEVPQDVAGGGESLGGLERREDRGSLSAHEKRLLERMRQRAPR
jgi:hypothetical protein